MSRGIDCATLASLWACGCTALVAQAQEQAVREQEGGAQATTREIVCSSTPGEYRHCPADTSDGIVITASTGTAECVRGETWGFDATSVWVADGCSGEFASADGAAGMTFSERRAAAKAAPDEILTWGEFSPGDGFLVGRSSAGELDISAYALVRYIDQTPGNQTFTDHLGNVRNVDAREDFMPHRAMVFFKGWVGKPQLVYNIILWTVNATDQDAVFGNLGYQFSRKFSVYGGLNGLPGTRTLQGSHPYWLGHDRVMADEFFRPYFTAGVWAQGEMVPGLWYNVEVGNNLSSLGIKASQLDREQSYSGSVWWMPTTKEFGPRGGFGDWEMHEEIATRFGISLTTSPEERFTDSATGAPGNTVIRLTDSVNVFETGALAPGVTVSNVDYQLLAIDAGFKYRGIFVGAEIYQRKLDNFVADGLVPHTSINDNGFYLQASFFPVPKKIELYAVTSQIYGDDDEGFDDASEFLVGMNWYPTDSRNHRLNAQVIDVDHSPVSSTFGYYTGGQSGKTYSVAFSIFF
jgi:hypothetical protein